MGYTWLNLGSLLLGILAWALPATALLRKPIGKSLMRTILFSLGACSLALLMQIGYQNHLVNIGDWTALEDTSGALLWVSTVLVLVSLLLNGLLLARARLQPQAEGTTMGEG